MQLLSLELNGFKSFADKTVIKFKPGITGIVGPNGSGKSNLIEAIRWVLGEQSAKNLRGDKMADVIFNGSADRKPLNRAMVSVKFDNSDHYLQSNYTEIEVTRKLYRNGDSEYLLNGSQVRLKDINDLFIDSGLGRESFSVISQGRIAAIFNGKPLDRRQIIETVAGVAKYKQDKTTAQKRLADTNDNLNRVNDIVAELKEQLDPLEEEAGIAQDYLEQKKQFDLYDRTQTVRQIDQQQGQLDQMQSQLDQVKGQGEDYAKQVKKSSAQLSQLQKSQSQLVDAKDNLAAKVLATTQLIAKLKNKQSLAQIHREERQKRLSDLKKQLQELLQKIQELQDQIDKQKQVIAEQEANIDQHKQSLKRFREQSSANEEAKVKAKIEELRNHQIDLMQQSTDLHNQLLFAKQTHDRSAKQAHENDTQLQASRQRLALLQEQNQQTTKAIQKDGQQLDDLRQQLQSQETKLQQLQGQYENTQHQWYRLLGDVHAEEGRIKNYHSMRADYAGYYYGVAAVLKKRQSFPRLLGSVSELISVPAKLTTAIETALGSQLQQLVVRDQQTAKEIIHYLVCHRAGRATILPLDTLSRGRVLRPMGLDRLAGYLGVASQLIQFPADIQVVIDHLLGTTVIADNLDHATVIARAAHHQARVVTLDGQVVNASGSLTGGANRQHRIGLLTQKKQAAAFEADLKKVKASAAQAEQRVHYLDDQRKAGRQSVEQLQNKLTKLQKQYNDEEASQKVTKNQLTNLQRQLNAMQYESASQEEGHSQYLQKQKQLQAQLKKVQTDLATVKEQVKSEQDRQQELSDNASSNAEQIHQEEQWLAVAKERQTQLRRDLRSLQTSLADNQKAIEANRSNQHEIKSADQSSDDDEESASASLAKCQDQLAQSKQDQKDNADRLTTIDQQIQDHNESLQRLRALQDATMDDLNRLNSEHAKLAATIDNGLNRLSDRYGMSLAEAKKNVSDADEQTVATKLKLLKRGLSELGEVNVGAIDQYKQVKERYDFLTSQRDDLVTAKQQLLTTMNSIDQQVKDQFLSTFKKVSKAFSQTFKDIFDGGQAKLILTDPDNLLETGVDIMAQPPGKRNQRLSLLSGGEQALTAIALLFAILKVRPVPFAILDEPEAALDAVNVDRFAHYLERFGTDGPQFIVITHRKGTMMNADVLYGVTMQESGVSKMVSVDVADALSAAETSSNN